MLEYVTVVIPNHNGKHYINTCLKSLKECNSLKVIIIDNGSNDGSKTYIKDKYPEFTLIENKRNLGFAAAVNQGIRASGNDYVFLLNNDTEIEKNCISNLVKCIESDENIFAVSSKMIQYENRTKMDDAGDEYTLLGWTRKVGNGRSPDLYTERRDVFSACAGAALYRRKIFNEIGLFDENFFAYLEDVDIGYRAGLHGYRSVYCPEAVVYHHGSGTSGSRYNEFKVRISARNNVYLPYKNMPWPQLALNFVFLLLGYFMKYLFFLKKGYGREYLDGLREGFKTRHAVNKIDHRSIKDYLRMEWLLLKGTLKSIL